MKIDIRGIISHTTLVGMLYYYNTNTNTARMPRSIPNTNTNTGLKVNTSIPIPGIADLWRGGVSLI